MRRIPEPASEGAERVREAIAYVLAIVIPYWLANPLFRKLLSGCRWETGSYGWDIVSRMSLPWGALFILAIAAISAYFLDQFAHASDLKPIEAAAQSELALQSTPKGLIGVIRPVEPENRPSAPRPSRRFLAAVAFASVGVAALANLAGYALGALACR